MIAQKILITIRFSSEIWCSVKQVVHKYSNFLSSQKLLCCKSRFLLTFGLKNFLAWFRVGRRFYHKRIGNSNQHALKEWIEGKLRSKKVVTGTLLERNLFYLLSCSTQPQAKRSRVVVKLFFFWEFFNSFVE